MDYAPGVLPGTDVLVADLDKVRGADDGEGKDVIHGLVRLCDGVVGLGELVDLHTVVQQLGHDLSLETDNREA